VPFQILQLNDSSTAKHHFFQSCEEPLFTSSPSCHVDVGHAFHGAHVLGTLEGAGIGAAELAHAALHLLHGFVLVLFHPLAHLALHVPWKLRS
jgi:hypothetical protein